LDHPFRALAFVAVTVLIAGAAFLLGMWVRSPDSAVLDARGTTVPVYASVESRTVTADIRIQGEVSGTQQQPVSVNPPAGAERIVVTSVSANPGQLTNGQLLGTVSNRPVFLFSVDIPLFRNLVAGDTGSDVASLQKALGVPQTGKVDSATLSAVRFAYSAASIEPPGGRYSTTITTAEFYTVPTSLGALSLISIAPAGSSVDSDHPFAVLGTGSPYVSVRASVSEAEQIKQNDKVSITGSGGKKGTGTVAKISEFQSSPTSGGRPPGRDIQINLDAGGNLKAGDAVAVLFGTESKPDMAVPTIAIRSDSGGDYVIKRSQSTTPARTPVVVQRNADGWTAIKAEGLAVGDQVLVSQ
jgi:hypothetical protein